MRTVLGVIYAAMGLAAAGLPFFAFGPTGLLILLPTGLWLAPGLRTRARRVGSLRDGVVGWPGLTTLVCAAASLALMALGGRVAAAWLAACAACGLIEMARARIAMSDNRSAEFKSDRPRF